MEGWDPGLQKGLFPADYDFSGHPTRLSEDKVKKVVPLVSYDIDYWKIYIDDKRVPPTLSLGDDNENTPSAMYPVKHLFVQDPPPATAKGEEPIKYVYAVVGLPDMATVLIANKPRYKPLRRNLFRGLHPTDWLSKLGHADRCEMTLRAQPSSKVQPVESRPGWAWVVVQLDTFRYQHGGLRPSSLMEGWEKRIKASIEKPEKYGWSKASKINEVGWVKEVPEDGLKMNPAIKEWPESADKLKVWPKAATEEDEEVVETQAYNPRESAQPIGLSKVAKKLVDDSVDSEVRRISEAIDRSPFPATKSLAHMIIEAVASSPWSANKPPKRPLQDAAASSPPRSQGRRQLEPDENPEPTSESAPKKARTGKKGSRTATKAPPVGQVEPLTLTQEDVAAPDAPWIPTYNQASPVPRAEVSPPEKYTIRKRTHLTPTPSKGTLMGSRLLPPMQVPIPDLPASTEDIQTPARLAGAPDMTSPVLATNLFDTGSPEEPQDTTLASVKDLSDVMEGLTGAGDDIATPMEADGEGAGDADEDEADDADDEEDDDADDDPDEVEEDDVDSEATDTDDDAKLKTSADLSTPVKRKVEAAIRKVKLKQKQLTKAHEVQIVDAKNLPKERLVITELQGGDQLMGKKELKKDLAETQTKNEEGELVDHPSFFRGKERNFAPLIETERQMDSDTYNFIVLTFPSFTVQRGTWLESRTSICTRLGKSRQFPIRELARLSDTPLKHYEQRPFHDERVTQIMKLGVRPDAMKAAHAFVNLGDKRATLADEKAVLKRLRECKDIEEELAAIKKKWPNITFGMASGKHSTAAAIQRIGQLELKEEGRSSEEQQLLDDLQYRQVVLWPGQAVGTGDARCLVAFNNESELVAATENQLDQSQQMVELLYSGRQIADAHKALNNGQYPTTVMGATASPAYSAMYEEMLGSAISKHYFVPEMKKGNVEVNLNAMRNNYGWYCQTCTLSQEAYDCLLDLAKQQRSSSTGPNDTCLDLLKKCIKIFVAGKLASRAALNKWAVYVHEVHEDRDIAVGAKTGVSLIDKLKADLVPSWYKAVLSSSGEAERLVLKKIEEASLAKWKAVEWALCKNKVEQLNKVNSVKLGEALGDTTPGQMLEGVNKLMKVITAIQYIGLMTNPELDELTQLPRDPNALPTKLRRSWDEIQKDDFVAAKGHSFHWWNKGDFALTHCQSLLDFIEKGQFGGRRGTSGDEDLMPTVKQALDMMRSTRTSKKGDVVEKPTNKERRAGARLLRTTLDKLVARKKGYPNKAGTMRVATMPHFPDVPEFYDMKKVRYDTCHDLLDCDIPLDGWSVPALLLDAPASSHRGDLWNPKEACGFAPEIKRVLGGERNDMNIAEMATVTSKLLKELQLRQDTDPDLSTIQILGNMDAGALQKAMIVNGAVSKAVWLKQWYWETSPQRSAPHVYLGVWDMCLSLKNGTFLEHYASRLGYKALPGNQPQLVMVTPLSKRQRNEDLDPDGSLWTPKLMDNLVIELDAAHAAHPQCGVLVVVRLSDELLGWTPPPRMVATSEGTQKEQRHLNRFTNLQHLDKPRGREHQMYLCFRVGRNGTPADGQPHEPTLAYSLENQNLLNIPPLVNFPGPGVRLLMDSVDRPRSSVDDVMSENEISLVRVEDRQASKKERSVLNPAEGGQPPFALVHLIIRSMATRPGSPVVVLGSGTGQEMLAAVRLGHPVYGFERSRVLVQDTLNRFQDHLTCEAKPVPASLKQKVTASAQEDRDGICCAAILRDMIRLSKNREGDELILQIDDRLSEAVMEFLSCMAGIMVEKQIYKYIEIRFGGHTQDDDDGGLTSRVGENANGGNTNEDDDANFGGYTYRLPQYLESGDE